MTFITGSQVSLRGFSRHDLPDYKKWLENPEVNRFLEMGSRPLNERDLEKVYSQSVETPDNYVFIIQTQPDEVAIGTAGIWDINWLSRRGDFRIIIGNPEFHGLGIGAEVTGLLTRFAFEHLNLETLTLGFNAENIAAKKTYEKAGFVLEGRRRQLLFRNGKYYDVIYMSMLRGEYENHRS